MIRKRGTEDGESNQQRPTAPCLLAAAWCLVALNQTEGCAPSRAGQVPGTQQKSEKQKMPQRKPFELQPIESDSSTLRSDKSAFESDRRRLERQQNGELLSLLCYELVHAPDP